ncbi:claw keratin-like isoform X2 [Poecile atricapillus]|uniref:claw keratin-like isoform X2 n=1 Tax=Poecile atricapillus TaxID=48891 RepID=UPI0027394C72|nr:claw keratin-like isoform X2 [Poecile atricapillus]
MKQKGGEVKIEQEPRSLRDPHPRAMVHSLSPCTDGSASPCGVAVPQPVADSCNEPCVRQCPDSTVVIYPPPVVVTFPGPILSTFPQQSVVGSAGVPEVSAGAGAGVGAGVGGAFGAARTPGASQVCGGARWARGYPVGSCRPCC